MVPLFTGHLSASHGLLPAFKGLCSMPAMASGVLIVITDQGEAELAVSDQGLIIGAMIRGKGDQGLFALKKILDWKIGEYAFFEGDEYPNEHIKKTLRMDMLSIVRGMEGVGGGGGPGQPQPQAQQQPQQQPQQPQQQVNPAAYGAGQQQQAYQQNQGPASGPVGMPMSAPPMQPYAQGQGYPQQQQYANAPNQAPAQAQPQAYGQQQQQAYSQPSTSQPAAYAQQSPQPQQARPPQPPQQQQPGAPSDAVPAKPGDKKKPRKFASTNFAMDVFTEDKPLAPKLKADEKVDDLMHNLTNLNRLGAATPAPRPAQSPTQTSAQSSMSSSQVMKGPQGAPPSGMMPPPGVMPPAGMMNTSQMGSPASQGASNAELQRQSVADEAALRQSMANMPAAVNPQSAYAASQELQQNAYLAEQQLLQSISSAKPPIHSSPASALQNLMSQSTSGGYPDFQQGNASGQYAPVPTPTQAQAPVAPSYVVPQSAAPAQPVQPQSTPAPVPPAAVAPTAQKKGRVEVTATLIEAPVFTDEPLFEETVPQSSLISTAPEAPYGQQYGQSEQSNAESAYDAGTQSGTDYNAVQQQSQSGSHYNAISQPGNSGTDYNALNQGTQSGTEYNAIGQSDQQIQMDQSYGGSSPSAMSSRQGAGGTSAMNTPVADPRAGGSQGFSQSPSFGPGADSIASQSSTKSKGTSILEAMKRRQLGIPDDQPVPSLRSSEGIPPLAPAVVPQHQPEPIPSMLTRPEQVPSMLSRPGQVPSMLGRPEPVPSILSRPNPMPPSLASSDRIDPVSLESNGSPQDFGGGTTSGGATGRHGANSEMPEAAPMEMEQDQDSRSGSSRGRLSKPGLSSRGMPEEQSFFQKNKILLIVGFVFFVILLVGGIVGALFFFHIISLSPPH